MGKGDKRRPRTIGSQEEELRWELMNSKTTQKRKEEIIKALHAQKPK